MQGNRLAIVTYGIGVLPLITQLKVVNPDFTQPWYADHAGALGTFYYLELYFNSLKCNGQAWGYYPEPTKIILTVHPENLRAGKLFGGSHGFKGVRYLGPYIRNDKSKHTWLKYWTEKCDRNICTVTKIAGIYPQEIYATVLEYFHLLHN